MIERVARTFAVLGFASTHEALSAEEHLLATGIDVVPIPTPKNVGALCGISLRLELDSLGLSLSALSEAGLVPAAQGEIEDV